MTTIFLILIILASIILGFIILVQNPKGGGLAGSIAGFSNQFMGVKQTTDVLEKGTWLFGGVIAVLCLVSTLFISGSATTGNRAGSINDRPVNTTTTNPGSPSGLPGAAPQTTPPDSGR